MTNLVEELMTNLCNKEYERKSYNNEIVTYKVFERNEFEKIAVREVITDWLSNLDITKLNAEIGKLEAKCYAYEQILANSNFSMAVIKENKNNCNKQIPQQVEFISDGYDPDGNLVYDYAHCPNCQRAFEESDENWECGYCPCCGQALKWWDNE